MDHAWLIEEREYARQEARRGRRHAFENIDPTRTALVVVDLVPFFFTENDYVRATVPRVNSLAAALRAAGGTVAWVAPAPTPPSPAYDEFLGPDAAEVFRGAGGEGPVRDRLWPELEAADGDVYAEKSTPSAFFPGRSDLPQQLTRIDTLLVTGTVTNVCVEGTVRDASALGYRIVVVADACAARRDQDHNATLHTVYRIFGDVRPTAEVLELIAG